MITILVAGDGENQTFYNALFAILSRHLTADPCDAEHSKEYMPIKLCQLKGFIPTKDERVIIICNGRHPIPCEPDFERIVAIVDSSDTGTVKQLIGTGLPTLTCGLRSRDTITLSSIAEESAVVDLRRSINCLDGSIAEAQEFPLLHPAPINHFLLMSAAAALILCGRVECLKEGFIEQSADEISNNIIRRNAYNIRANANSSLQTQGV